MGIMSDTASQELHITSLSSESQEIVVPSGVEVEKVMLEKEKQENIDPTELASTMFALYFPKYLNSIERLSSNSLRRLAKALVGFPLEEFNVNSSNKLEAEAFAIGRALLDAKMMMVFQTYSSNLDTLQEAATSSEDTSVEKEVTNKQGETDGEV